MKDNLNTSLLLDFYSGLLTEKQRDALDMYYNLDLSLGEIAEEIGVTRQGVRDTIKKGEERLLSLEEKIGMCSFASLVSLELDKIESEAEGIEKNKREKILESIAAIRSGMEL